MEGLSSFSHSSCAYILNQDVRSNLLKYYPTALNRDPALIQKLLLDVEKLASEVYAHLASDAAQLENSPESMSTLTLLHIAQQYHENLLRNIVRIIQLSPSQLFSSSLPFSQGTEGPIRESVTPIPNGTDPPWNKRLKSGNDINKSHPCLSGINPVRNITPMVTESRRNIVNNTITTNKTTNHFDHGLPISNSSTGFIRSNYLSSFRTTTIPEGSISDIPNSLLSSAEHNNHVKYIRSNTLLHLPSSSATAVAVPTLKRANLAEEQKTILREWFIQNIDHPYPTEKEKEELAHQVSTTIERVSNWFINARARDWSKLKQQTENNP